MTGRLLFVLAVMAGCGKVSDKPAADGPGGDGPPGDATPDACVPTVRVAVQFTATNLNGNNPSTLDKILNFPNGFVLTVPTWVEERGIESFGGTQPQFKTAIKATTPYTIDYTGHDEALLDSEVGAFLTVGGAFRQSVFDLADNKSIFLYLLPVQPNQHPYMDVRCNGAPFTTDPQTNFPILKSFTATGCNLTFFDQRPTGGRNIVATQNVTFDLTYQPCRP
jgi:hypothetical protein